MKNFIVTTDSASDFEVKSEKAETVAIFIYKKCDHNLDNEQVPQNTQKNRALYYETIENEKYATCGADFTSINAMIYTNLKSNLDCLHLGLSSIISGTTINVKSYLEQHPISSNYGKLVCVDTESASVGELLLFDLACKMSESLALDDAKKEIEKLIPKLRVIFFVDNLYHLNANGRMKTEVKKVDGYKNPRFICEIKNGKIEFVKQVNGDNLAIKHILNKITEDADNNFDNIYVSRAKNLKIAEMLLAKIEQNTSYKTRLSFISPVSVVHVGTSAVGVAYISK